MIGCLAALLRRTEDDAEMLLQLALANELRQRCRTESGLEHPLVIRRARPWVDEVLTHGATPAN
jgi:hypothetical protein